MKKEVPEMVIKVGRTQCMLYHACARINDAEQRRQLGERMIHIWERRPAAQSGKGLEIQEERG